MNLKPWWTLGAVALSGCFVTDAELKDWASATGEEGSDAGEGDDGTTDADSGEGTADGGADGADGGGTDSGGATDSGGTDTGGDGGGGDGADGSAEYNGVLELIEAQTFDMGCTAGQASTCASDEYPVTTVTLTGDFYIGLTEVTQGEYTAVMGDNPSASEGCGDDCPVENVSWYEAAAFANAVSDIEGLTHCYSCSGSGADVECDEAMSPYDCDGYRLPTEAEWEAAARCGEDLLYAGSVELDVVGWYYDNSEGTPHFYGEKEANACGLYDMSGNVWEWVADWYELYHGGAEEDPTGPSYGDYRVYRGGSWAHGDAAARITYRDGDYAPGTRYPAVGFRLARSADP